MEMEMEMESTPQTQTDASVDEVKGCRWVVVQPEIQDNSCLPAGLDSILEGNIGLKILKRLPLSREIAILLPLLSLRLHSTSQQKSHLGGNLTMNDVRVGMIVKIITESNLRR